MRTLVLVMIGLLLAGPASAGRNDGEQPGQASPQSARLNSLLNASFNSGVCDELVDATPGLRMMCMAFCEIQTCEPDFTLENPLANCSKSSQWIYDRYQARRGPGDPDMPCMQAPQTSSECPCWTVNELAGLRFPVAGDRPSCFVDLNAPSAGISNMDSWRIFSSDGGVTYATSVTSAGIDMDGASSCQLSDRVTDPLTGEVTTTSRYLTLTAEQLAACETDIALSAANRGLTCTVLP